MNTPLGRDNPTASLISRHFFDGSPFTNSCSSRFARGALSWGVALLLFLSPGLPAPSLRPQQRAPRAPLGAPGALLGHPWAPKAPPLGALIQLLSSVIQVCGHQLDRRNHSLMDRCLKHPTIPSPDHNLPRMRHHY